MALNFPDLASGDKCPECGDCLRYDYPLGVNRDHPTHAQLVCDRCEFATGYEPTGRRPPMADASRRTKS